MKIRPILNISILKGFNVPRADLRVGTILFKDCVKKTDDVQADITALKTRLAKDLDISPDDFDVLIND